MIELLFLIIGVLIGAIVLYVVLKPKLRAVQKLDEDTAIKNEHLRAELLELTKEHSSLTAKKEEILLNITTLQKQAEESANSLYEKSYELANEKMSQAAETMSKKYRDMEEVAKNEYKTILEDCVSSFQQQITTKQNELLEVNKKLSDLTGLNISVLVGEKAENCAAVGDQLFTDVWGANRAGIVSILTRPIYEDTVPFIKFKRLLEKPFLKRYEKEARG